MILVVLLYILLASTFTIGKTVLLYLNPIFFVGLRMTFGGLILLGYQYTFNRNKFFILKKDFLNLAQITLFHIFLSYTLEFWALKYLSSFKTALIYNFSPFFAAIFSFFLFSERMTIKKLSGLVIGFLGFFLILINGQSPGEASREAIWFLSWPEIALIGSVISGVYGWIVMKMLLKEGYSPILVNGFGMVSGGILALLSSFGLEGYPTINVHSESLQSAIFLSILYGGLLIIIANVIFYNLYGYLLKRYSVTLLSFAGFFCPLFAALYGSIFLNEYPSIYFFLSLIIISIGLYIFYQEELRQGYILE